MVQARALLAVMRWFGSRLPVYLIAAAASAVIFFAAVAVSRAMPVPSCEDIRTVAKQYTPAQLRAMAKRAKLTPEQWAAIKQCLEGK